MIFSFSIIDNKQALTMMQLAWKDMKKIISHFLSDLRQNGDRVSEKDRKDQYLH